MTWQWYVTQVFAFIGLIFIIIGSQQKTAKALVWFNNISTVFVMIGLCFLGEVSAIIMCGAGMIRNAVSLYFAYKPNTPNYVKIISGLLIVALLISLNIVFWKSWNNLFSIVIGTMLVITFLQKHPKTIRFLSTICQTLSIIYYSILLTPINVIIQIFSLISTIVGIIRLDIKKKIE